MRSTASEKSEAKAPFVCPVSVLSTIYSISNDEMCFFEAAKSNDLETVNQFIIGHKHRFKVREEESRILSLSDAALILAINKNNRDVIKLLVSKGFILREPHSRSCRCKECSCLGVLLKALSRLNTYKAMSNPTYLSYCYLYANPLESSITKAALTTSGIEGSLEPGAVELDAFKCKLDPIYRAFELNGKLERLAVNQFEFQKEYRALSNQCEVYAVELLNLCQNMKEIGCVMSMPYANGRRMLEDGQTTDLSVLNFAIKNKNERVSISLVGKKS